MRVIATLHPVPVEPGTETTEHKFIQPAPADPVEVTRSSYYQRRITSGELKHAEEVTAESGKVSGGAKHRAKQPEASL